MDLYINISLYIDLVSYIRLYLSSKELNILLNNIPYNIQKEYCLKKLHPKDIKYNIFNIWGTSIIKQYVKKYPKQLLELFDPIKLYKTPIIDLKNIVGLTGYIDFITCDYFNNSNIMRN